MACALLDHSVTAPDWAHSATISKSGDKVTSGISDQCSVRFMPILYCYRDVHVGRQRFGIGVGGLGGAMRNILSTITAARLLGVAVASIAKWIDAGQLKAGRTPGGHRRIAKEDLVEFLQRQQLPIPPELKTSPSRVLVVDDDASVTKWIAEEIKAVHPDLDVFQAHDGYSAGEIVASSKPDVVVLDLRMPGMDGFEVCLRLKSRKETEGTAVIAITAHPSPKVERRILESGARAYLTKPLKISDLIPEIESALSERG